MVIIGPQTTMRTPTTRTIVQEAVAKPCDQGGRTGFLEGNDDAAQQAAVQPRGATKWNLQGEQTSQHDLCQRKSAQILATVQASG